LAKDQGFDYISFKPYLVRDTEGKEVLPSVLVHAKDEAGIKGGSSIARIAEELDAARSVADEHFRVVPSVNLLAVFDEQLLAASRRQPRRCHMQALRQVVTPHGIYGCPGYRGDARSRISDFDGYVDGPRYRRTAAQTQTQIERFDASVECRNIACLYNETNWWLERLGADGPVIAANLEGDSEEPLFL
jgi:hypothetical protein